MASKGTAAPSKPNRRPGIREVAERAGVAISSVSRVLSGSPDVSDAMRTKVMAVVEELGYRPDVLAQSMRLQRTMSVGFAASALSNPVLAGTVVGAEGRLREAGYRMLLTDADGDPSLDAEHIALLEQRRVDGLLLSVSDEKHQGTIDALRAAEVPFVMIDRDAPRGSGGRLVAFDHRSGMRDASQHLRDLGHERVALITGGPRRPARERLAGVLEVFGEDGTEVLEGDLNIQHGSEAMAKLLDRPDRPTAVIAGGNMIMHGALRALRQRGVRLGEGLSFVGCDDVAVAEFHDPPIAVVRRDTRRSGEVAADLLIADLEGRKAPRRVVLPTEFIPQASCAPPPRSAKRRAAKASTKPKPKAAKPKPKA